MGSSEAIAFGRKNVFGANVNEEGFELEVANYLVEKLMQFKRRSS